MNLTRRHFIVFGLMVLAGSLTGAYFWRRQNQTTLIYNGWVLVANDLQHHLLLAEGLSLDVRD